LTGRVLNHLDFGGYMMWARDRPVFIDGRLEVVGEEFYDFYRSALDSPERLESTVASYGIEWFVFPYRARPKLVESLSRDRRWRLAYVDHLAVAFVREGPGAAALVDRTVRELSSAATVPDLADVPGLGAAGRPSAAAGWLAGLVHRIEFPTEPFYLGLFHLYRGEPAAAATRFADAVRASDGRWYETYHNLGGALYRLGALEPARRCYEIVLDEEPDQRTAAQRIAEIDRRLGRRRDCRGVRRGFLTAPIPAIDYSQGAAPPGAPRSLHADGPARIERGVVGS
jgi:hypothetical protein